MCLDIVGAGGRGVGCPAVSEGSTAGQTSGSVCALPRPRWSPPLYPSGLWESHASRLDFPSGQRVCLGSLHFLPSAPTAPLFSSVAHRPHTHRLPLIRLVPSHGLRRRTALPGPFFGAYFGAPLMAAGIRCRSLHLFVAF